MANLALSIVFTIIQFIVLLFVVIATPLPQFRDKKEYTVSDVHLCATLWGFTTKCNGVKYLWTGVEAFDCGRRASTMKCGAAFAIISIVFTLVALILGILLLVKVLPALGAVIVTAVCVITILISWACVAGVMTEKMCPINTTSYYILAYKYSTYFNYGAGFGLLVTAWCLEVVNLVIAILCMCLGV